MDKIKIIISEESVYNDSIKYNKMVGTLSQKEERRRCEYCDGWEDMVQIAPDRWVCGECNKDFKCPICKTTQPNYECYYNKDNVPETCYKCFEKDYYSKRTKIIILPIIILIIYELEIKISIEIIVNPLII